MVYKIEEIEGIGPQSAEALTRAGISNSADLLEKCADDTARARVAGMTGLSPTMLATWYRQADLMRVSGIGSEFGQLLEASGVRSVEELAEREPQNLANLLHRVNDMKRLTRSVPSMKTTSKWVRSARKLVGLPVSEPAAPAKAATPSATPSAAPTSAPGATSPTANPGGARVPTNDPSVPRPSVDRAWTPSYAGSGSGMTRNPRTDFNTGGGFTPR